jgi:glycosyltransferase involved in cell wall biosynthesis
MSKDIRVGIIVPNDFIKRLPFGGASGFIQNIISVAPWQTVIFGAGANGSLLWQEKCLNENTTFVATYPISIPSRRPLRLIAFAGYLLNRKRIINSNIDILYVHSPECALPFIFGRKRKPVVFHQHGSGNPVSTATYAWARNSFFEWIFDKIHQVIYNRSDWVIVIDKLCKAQAVAQGAGEKLSLLMNAVNNRQFFPDDKTRDRMRNKHGLSDKETAILFVGRLEEVKQVDRLIKCLPALEPGIGAKLFIAGEGSLRAGLERLAIESGIVAQVKFLGKISHNELPAYYNMADLLALPSKMEGVPMVILEALACGRPILATAVGGIPDLLVNGKNGVLMNEGSIIELAKGITDMAGMNWDRDQINNSASAWGAVSVSEKLVTVFKKLVEKK